MPGGLTEEGDVQDIRFAGVSDSCLGCGDDSGNQVLFDGIGVDPVVELGEGAVEIPCEREPMVFVLLKALKFLDEVELELN